MVLLEMLGLVGSKTSSVKFSGSVTSPCAVSQGAPHGSVLRPLFFNIAMPALSEHIPTF